MRYATRIRSVVLSAGAVLALGACEPAGQDAMQEGTDSEATQAVDSAAMAGDTAEQMSASPDTTAAALWSYLEAVDYASSWEMWPGKAAMYPATEPHGALLTTYVNETAMAGLTVPGETSAGLPAGAVIVKENYGADSALVATTVIFKSEGYDPPHNDWFWLKRNADGTVAASGRVEGCIACHGQRAANDYLMTETVTR